MTDQNRQPLDVPRLVSEAYERCRDHLLPTPLEYSLYLSQLIDGDVWLKLDTMQRTASFKFRGALNKILSLTEQEIENAIRLLFEKHRLVVEGSAALSVGGLLIQQDRFKGKRVAAVVCGRNIDLEVFKRIIGQRLPVLLHQDLEGGKVHAGDLQS
jgi:threonine dehydratase